MSSPLPLPPSPRQTSIWRGPLLLLAILTGLAVLLAGWHYATGDDQVLPIRPVSQLTPVPTTVAAVQVGVARLPVQANGYVITQTYDVAGPYLQPAAALALVLLLGAALAYWLAVVSTLTRPAFIAGMVLVIFLLMSLNADLLGIFREQEQYFLILTLVLLGGAAFGLHAFWPNVSFLQRLLLFGALVAGLGTLLFARSQFPADVTALHLTAFFTMSGAVAVLLLVLWVGYENVHGLLWLNTQSDNPAGRFGLLPFLLTSLLYLVTLLLYYWNNGELAIFPGWNFDPLVLLLPAVIVGWLGLRRRAAAYQDWLPFWPGMAHIYLVLVLLAATALGYAFATANDPLLTAARDTTALAFLTVGASFVVYVLVNFAPLIRKKLPVYRVVYEPRRLPFFAMYVLGLLGLGAVELRNNFFVVDQVRAGYFNNLGDLTRLQSELAPMQENLPLLAERYYAESDDLDFHNHKASLGRAALYRFRLQRQNEINILRRALMRRPSEKISLRLAALYNEPTDLFDRLDILRAALKAAPHSAALNGDMAQLYSRTALTDSVVFYQGRAEQYATTNITRHVLQTNQLAAQISKAPSAQDWSLIRELRNEKDDAVQSNLLLLWHRAARDTSEPQPEWPQPDTTAALSEPQFAHLYHAALFRQQLSVPAAPSDTSYASLVTKLARYPGNAPFLDQLTFLRAYLQHYGGRPVAAQTTLATLATGSSPAAAYYQQLQGLWLLDQHLAAPAARRLAQALQNGSPTAGLPAAYALALSNQPDSARRVARQVATGSELSIVRAAISLLAVLEPDFNTRYTQAPDSLKAQYLVVRGDELSATDLLPATQAITKPWMRKAALLAQLPRAIQAGQLGAAQAALQQAAPPVDLPEASAWNVVRGELYVRRQQWAQLRQLTSAGRFEGPDEGWQLYFRAALAEADKQPKQAAKLYATLVQQAPYVTTGVAAAADFYTRQRDLTLAYNTLLRGIEYNPESVLLLKAYILSAIPIGLNEYIIAPLEHLGALLSPTEYTTFRTEVEKKRVSHAPSAAPWN